MRERSSIFVVIKVGVVCQEDVRLMRALHDDSISTVEILATVKKVHVVRLSVGFSK